MSWQHRVCSKVGWQLHFVLNASLPNGAGPGIILYSTLISGLSGFSGLLPYTLHGGGGEAGFVGLQGQVCDWLLEIHFFSQGQRQRWRLLEQKLPHSTQASPFLEGIIANALHSFGESAIQGAAGHVEHPEVAAQKNKPSCAI